MNPRIYSQSPFYRDLRQGMMSLFKFVIGQIKSPSPVRPQDSTRLPFDPLELRIKAALVRNSLLKKQRLMDKIDHLNQDPQRRQKVKCTRENVLHIEEINGKIVFLERGNTKAGYKHILNHAGEFQTNNIPVAKLPQILFNSLRKNSLLGYQGKGTERPIYETDKVPVAITVGSNGYIVGANPNPKAA